MNYFIKRETQEYGPYSLAELQKYVASGNIALTDLCRSEAMTDWIPVSQVIGNIPVPQPNQMPGPMPGTPYAAPYVAPVVSPYPAPPSLHWGIMILLAVLTCGLFGWVWALVQAVWLRKIQPASRAIIFFACAIVLFATMLVLNVMSDPTLEAYVLLARLGGGVLWLCGAFSMKSSLEEHYNTVEPIGLDLNGVLVFFFSIYYFQYHFTQINAMRERQAMGYAR